MSALDLMTLNDGSGDFLLDDGDFVLGDSEGQNCCCNDNGCCPGILISGVSVLQAELIGDDTGCFTIGSTMDLDDLTSPGIWTSASGHGPGFFGQLGWKGLSIACGLDENGNDVLTMIWDNADFCPTIDSGTAFPGTFTWIRQSGQCEPLEFIFTFDLIENESIGPGCNCSGSTSIPGTVNGLVTVKITISP